MAQDKFVVLVNRVVGCTCTTRIIGTSFRCSTTVQVYNYINVCYIIVPEKLILIRIRILSNFGVSTYTSATLSVEAGNPCVLFSFCCTDDAKFANNGLFLVYVVDGCDVYFLVLSFFLFCWYLCR
ncbi:hypothetical protein RJT34_06474 [Clitoria ternatea]|uniref:Uncharacterized protein n=1 Tax=Clitoria ternatea TaxID=43366 RepID=A0AAN9K4V5_CLITE